MKIKTSPINFTPIIEDGSQILEKELGKEKSKELLTEIDKKIEEAFSYQIPQEKKRNLFLAFINRLKNK